MRHAAAHAPPRVVRRRRVGRLVRCIDPYALFAVLGILAYVVLVNLIAGSLEVHTQSEIKRKLALAATENTTEVPPHVFWPYKWPTEPLAELRVLRDGMDYVAASVRRLVPLLASLPAAQLALWDLALLTDAKTDTKLTVLELRRLALQALGAPVDATDFKATSASAATLREVREAVASVAVVWSVKERLAEAAEAELVLKELPALPANVSAAAATSWSSLCSAVWDRATGATATPSSRPSLDVSSVIQSLVDTSRLYWKQNEQGVAMLPLMKARLLPLQSGTYDTVVPLTRLLLHLWILDGRQGLSLVIAYDEAVETIIKDLLHTRTIDADGRLMNLTFVASVAGYVVPLATPRVCAFAGVLAEGARQGAHRYAARRPTMRYSEDDVLAAAEALAASCFQQYADPDGHHLRTPLYITSQGPLVGYVGFDARASAPQRQSYCDVPFLLMESFRELYLTTQDPMYGLWSLLVMGAKTSDHCAVSAADLATSVPWRRHIRELRSLWLLLHRMDCLVYRRSRGTRGLCAMTTSTMVSPLTGHLLRIPTD